MITLTTGQAQWVIDNILWVVPCALFLFTSLVIGFWKLIGKLFRKNYTQEEIPQDPSDKLAKPEVSSPQVPVEEKDDYLDLTK